MIQPKPATVLEILNPTVQYVVPKFQRDYSWGKGEVSEFLDDLLSEAEPGRGLFLGTLIFDTSGESEKKITIVDGQQRLTTILLLLIACRNRAREIREEGIASQTQQRITFVDPTTAKSLGPLLVASESIREVFETMSDIAWDGSIPLKVGGKQVKRKANRVRPIWEVFTHYLTSHDSAKLSQLLDAIYKTRVIRIDIQGEEEAFSIFERTNARGVDLEVSDLLKNYLYQQEVPGLDERWSEIIRNSDGTMLRMLKYFYVSRKGYIKKSYLYKGIKQYCKDIGGATHLIEQLVDFSKFYNVIRKEEDSAVLKKYFESLDLKAVSSDQDKYERIHIALQGLRLFKISQIYPLIDAAIRCFARCGGKSSKPLAKTIVALLQGMEKYHFINNAICDRIGNEVEKLYADFCDQYGRSKDFEKTTKELLAKLRTQLASEEEFTTRFCELSYSTSTIPLIAYVFDRLNNFDLAPGERIKIYNPLPGTRRTSHNIEHIYPQKPKSDAIPNAETLEVGDNIGNLLAISFRSNSSLGNLSPREKVQKMKGELSKKIQNLTYIKTFVEGYASFFDSWDKDAIRRRAQDLAKQAYCEVWRL